MRAILKETVLPEGRVALGSLLTEAGRSARLTEEEAVGFSSRDAAPAEPLDLE